MSRGENTRREVQSQLFYKGKRSNLFMDEDKKVWWCFHQSLSGFGQDEEKEETAKDESGHQHSQLPGERDKNQGSHL